MCICKLGDNRVEKPDCSTPRKWRFWYFRRNWVSTPIPNSYSNEKSRPVSQGLSQFDLEPELWNFFSGNCLARAAYKCTYSKTSPCRRGVLDCPSLHLRISLTLVWIVVKLCLSKVYGIILSKNQIVVPAENDVFDIFEGFGCQLRLQIFNWMKRADPCFGVCRNSAWSPSYYFFFQKLLKSTQSWLQWITNRSIGGAVGCRAKGHKYRNHVKR